jgi:hypothetical protein
MGSVAQADRVTGNGLRVMGEAANVCEVALVLMTVVKNTAVVSTGSYMPAGREAATKLVLELPTPGMAMTFQDDGMDDCCGSYGPVGEATALRAVTLLVGFAAMFCVADAVFAGAVGPVVPSG